MNWQTTTQIGDYEPDHAFEIRCKSCRLTDTVHAGAVQQRLGSPRLYLDEAQARLRCRACGGAVVLSQSWKHKMSGFTGGLV